MEISGVGVELSREVAVLLAVEDAAPVGITGTIGSRLAADVVLVVREVVIVALELLKVVLRVWIAGGIGYEKGVEDVITTDERVGSFEDCDDGVAVSTEADLVIVPEEADGVLVRKEVDGVLVRTEVDIVIVLEEGDSVMVTSSSSSGTIPTSGVITAWDDEIIAEEVTGTERRSMLETGTMITVEDGIGIGVEAADDLPTYEYVCTGEMTGAKMRRSKGMSRPLSKKELIPLIFEPLKSVSSGVTVVVNIRFGATAGNWSVRERV